MSNVEEPPVSPVTAAPKRRLLLALVSLLTVVGLVAAGVVVWQLFGKSGGASSPEAAATQLMSAIQKQDAVGFASAIEPDEVRGLSDVMTNLQKKAQASFGQAAAGKGATSLTLSGLTYATSSLADGVSSVQITGGTYDLKIDPSKLTGMAKMAVPAKDFKGNIADIFAKAGIAPSLLAVKHDGGWYISLLGTGANLGYEAAQKAGAVPASVKPDWNLYANPPAPIVAKDPEGVVQNMVSALNHQSFSEILRNLPAAEARPLFPFEAFIQWELDKGGSDKTVVTVSDIKVTQKDLHGDVAATYTGLKAKNSDGSSVVLESPCATVDGHKQCIPSMITNALGFTGVTLVLRHQGDGLQVDPVASLVNGLNALTNHFDDIKKMVQDMFAGFAGEMSSGFGSSSSSM